MPRDVTPRPANRPNSQGSVLKFRMQDTIDRETSAKGRHDIARQLRLAKVNIRTSFSASRPDMVKAFKLKPDNKLMAFEISMFAEDTVEEILAGISAAGKAVKHHIEYTYPHGGVKVLRVII
tara:strand:+ start:189 stop:554 length:366 start_codon:yes stop_codon:yes gene_type:complete